MRGQLSGEHSSNRHSCTAPPVPGGVPPAPDCPPAPIAPPEPPPSSMPALASGSSGGATLHSLRTITCPGMHCMAHWPWSHVAIPFNGGAGQGSHPDRAHPTRGCSSMQRFKQHFMWSPHSMSTSHSCRGGAASRGGVASRQPSPFDASSGAPPNDAASVTHPPLEPASPPAGDASGSPDLPPACGWKGSPPAAAPLSGPPRL